MYKRQVHDIELEDIGRAYKRSPMNSFFHENQPVYTANAAYNGLYIPAYRKNLDVRLLVLSVIAPRRRPCIGIVNA